MTETDNITLSTIPEEPVAPSSPFASNEVKLTAIQVTDENAALNLMVSFLNVAQRRGAFSLDESSKIWECVQKFIQTPN